MCDCPANTMCIECIDTKKPPSKITARFVANRASTELVTTDNGFGGETTKRTAAKAQPADKPGMATREQRDLIRKLLTEKAGHPTVENIRLEVREQMANGGIRRRDASEQIKTLLALPRPAVTDLDDGMYRTTDGTIFKVYHTANGANQQVAKRLVVLDTPYTKTVRGKQVEVKAEFEYEGKRPLRKITAEMKMTLDEAIKFGAVYGVCCVCSATLTNEDSIEAGIGPVCATKF